MAKTQFMLTPGFNIDNTTIITMNLERFIHFKYLYTSRGYERPSNNVCLIFQVVQHHSLPGFSGGVADIAVTVTRPYSQQHTKRLNAHVHLAKQHLFYPLTYSILFDGMAQAPAFYQSNV